MTKDTALIDNEAIIPPGLTPNIFERLEVFTFYFIMWIFWGFSLTGTQHIKLCYIVTEQTLPKNHDEVVVDCLAVVYRAGFKWRASILFIDSWIKSFW